MALNTLLLKHFSYHGCVACGGIWEEHCFLCDEGVLSRTTVTQWLATL